MTTIRFMFVVAVSTIVTCSAAMAAPPPPKKLPDWPCAKADNSPLSLADLLKTPIAGHDDSAWKSDPAAMTVADYIAAPENTADMGIVRIQKFAAQLGPDQRSVELPRVLDGLVTRANELRAIIREGIEHKVVESRLLDEVVTGNERAIELLPANAPPSSRTALEGARRSNASALGDRDEDAEMFCRRYEYTEGKARRLAEAVVAQMAPATSAPAAK